MDSLNLSKLVLGDHFIAHACDFEDIFAHAVYLQVKITILIREGTFYKGTVGQEQLQGSLIDAYLGFLVYDLSCDVLLSVCMCCECKPEA